MSSKNHNKTFQFSSRMEKFLIKKYEENSTLWNIVEPGYKNRNKKNAAYQKILEELKTQFPEIPNIDSDCIRNKLNRMKAYYSNLRNKQRDIGKSGAGAEDVETFQPKWEHFERLNFLEPTTTSTNTKSSFNFDSDSASNSSVSTSEFNIDDCVANIDNSINIEDVEDSSDGIPPTPMKRNIFAIPATNPHPQRNKRKKFNTPTVMEEAAASLIQSLNEPTVTVPVITPPENPKMFTEFFENDNAEFCMFIAKEMKKMKEDTRQKFILGVTSLMFCNNN